MNFQYTRRQTPRGALADAEDDKRIVLAKNTSTLRATYQIRLLAYRAEKEGKQLVIHVPPNCAIMDDLTSLVASLPKRVIAIRRTP